MLSLTEAGRLPAPSFFYSDGEPVRAEEAPGLFRQGMLRIARATGAEQIGGGIFIALGAGVAATE